MVSSQTRHRPVHGVPRRERQQGPPRLADLSGVREHRVGRTQGSGIGGIEHQARLPALRTQRLHLRDRSPTNSACSAPMRCIGGFVLLVVFGIQTALAAPDRFGMLRRRRCRVVVRGAGARQRRRRHRADAGHRADAAVLLGRRAVRCSSRMVAAGLLLSVARRVGRTGPDRSAWPEHRSPSSRVAARPATCCRRSPWPMRWCAAGHEPTTIHYVGASEASRPDCCPTRRTRTRSSTSSGSSVAERREPKTNLGFVPRCSGHARQAIGTAASACDPSVVVTVGGYASMPAVFAARRLDIPVVVVSYDRRPGRASRVAARGAAACAVAFDGSDAAARDGSPERRSARRSSTSTVPGPTQQHASASASPADRFMVAVMGGSLGSGVLNTPDRRLRRASRDDERRRRASGGGRAVRRRRRRTRCGGGRNRPPGRRLRVGHGCPCTPRAIC